MSIDFEKGNGLVPVIVQDANSGQVLMLAYMNREAYERTKKTARATFYSRSRDALWEKGETSGNWLEVVNVIADCDNDTLLLKVVPNGPVCHTGSDTCFRESNPAPYRFLEKLDRLIETRKADMPAGSYTTSLFGSGVNKIAQKVGEEAVELIIEAKDSNDELFLNEAADLLYHLIVLLRHKSHSFEDVISVLEKRHG